jgi:hypothetical protein
LIGIFFVVLPWVGVFWLELKNGQQTPTAIVLALTDRGPCLSIPSECRWSKSADNENVNIYCQNGTVATWSKSQRPQTQGAILQKVDLWQIMLLKDEPSSDKGRADYLLMSLLPEQTEAFSAVVYYNSANLKLLGSLVACPANP